MTPGKFNLSLYRGDTYQWRFVLWADAEKTVPVDLAGVTVKSEIRDKPGGTLQATLACEIESPNIIVAALSAVESEKLIAPAAAWDLQLCYNSGDVTTILAGQVKITQDVTESCT